MSTAITIAHRAAIRELINSVDQSLVDARLDANDRGIPDHRSSDPMPDLEDDDLPDSTRHAFALYYAGLETTDLHGQYLSMLEHMVDGEHAQAIDVARAIVARAVHVISIVRSISLADAVEIVRFEMGGCDGGYYGMTFAAAART